ncbi:hypothetical protein ACFLSJ_06020, partial [Verrucomicrobiota bacterium]
WDEAGGKPPAEMWPIVRDKIGRTARGRMMAGAFRAWKTSWLVGIGPGMHRNLWAHFSASADGDREKGRWPSLITTRFHSFEVHGDWLQLLEEYGLAGLALFLFPMSVLSGVLLSGIPVNRDGRDAGGSDRSGPGRHAVVLGGLLAGIAMAFHSLGDFNLQVPATTWTLAALVSVAAAHAVQCAGDGTPARSGSGGTAR